MKLRVIVTNFASPPSELPLCQHVRLACRKLLVLGLAASLGLPMASFAADGSDDIDQELQVLRQLAQQMLQRIESLEKKQKALAAAKNGTAPALAAAPAPAPEPVIKPSLKFTPKGFKFVGNTVYGENELKTLLAGDIDKEVDFDGLTEIADKVKGHYTKNGYFLAQAVLPAQEVADGIVTIEVLEGRIGKIQFDSPLPKTATITESQFRGMVESRLKEGDLITENTLERPLLQLRDLPGVDVSSVINPGDVPGTANILLTVKPLPNPRSINSSLELDNSGNRFAGEYRLTGKADLIAPLGIGDSVSLNATIAEKTDNLFGRIGYLAPVGHLGTRVGGNLSHLNYALGKNFTELEVQGSASVAELVAVHPFLRTRGYNLFGQVGIEKKRLVDQQLGVPDQKKEIDSVKFQLSGSYRGDGHVNTGSVDLVLGRLKFKDADQFRDDQGPSGFFTAGSFAKLNFSANRLQQFAPNLDAVFTLSGQLASKNLTSAEKFVLGGANRVRGYPAGEAGGDQGFVASAELRYTLSENFKIWNARPVVSAFVDYGLVMRNRDTSHAALADPNASNSRSLAAFGIGFKWGIPDEFLLRSDLAWGRSGKATSDAEARSPRLWFQGIRWF